jgi:hypothetical protein
VGAVNHHGKIDDSCGHSFRFLGYRTEHFVPNRRNLGMLMSSVFMVIVPDRRNQGVLMSSVCLIMVVLPGRGDKGMRVGPGGFFKWGSWLWARDQQGWEFATMYKKPPFQGKGYFSAKINHGIVWNIVLCATSMKRKYSPVQVK